MTFRFSKSNPQLTSSIEMATDGHQMKSEDWAFFMTICDLVNSSEDGPKEAVKSIKKRFATKHPPTIALTLSLLESLMKNCGGKMHAAVCTKEFMGELMKVISSKNNYSISLQNSVLALIQNWALAFQRNGDLKEVNKTYMELKNKGVEFPPVNQDDQHMLQSSATASPHRTLHPSKPQSSSSSPRTSSSSSSSPRKTAIPQKKIDKLRNDMAIVHQNAALFGDLLTAVCEGSDKANPELMEDLYHTCKEMQKRVLALIQKVQLEELTGELLQSNDELNNQFVRYERYARSTQQQKQQQNNNNNNNTNNNNNNNNESVNLDSKAPSTTKTSSSSSNNVYVDNLIDLGSNSSNNNNNNNNNNTNPPGLSEDMLNLDLNASYPFSPFENSTAQSGVNSQNMMRESDLKEMEDWLGESEVEKQASTGEFERFLQQRMKESDTLPENKK